MNARAIFILVTIAIAAAAGLFASGPSMWFLFSRVVAPTALIATAFSFVLIGSRGLASLGAWLCAGVLIPVMAVVGLFAADAAADWLVDGEYHVDSQIGIALLSGSVITVPIGIVGLLALRALLRRRFATVGSVA